MENLLEPEDIEWKYVKHLTMTTQSHMLFRDERFKIQWEQITNRDGHGKVGKSKNYFFIDNKRWVFSSLFLALILLSPIIILIISFIIFCHSISFL